MLPLGLRQVLESESGVLFLGAGIGHNALDDAGRMMPDAHQLAQELCREFGIDASADVDLAKAAQIVDLRKGRAELLAFLTKRLKDFKPDESLCWLLSRPWRAIFTTNYDHVIQRAYELNPNPVQTPVTISSVGELVDYDPRFQVPVYHLHGAVFDVPQQNILITENDYAEFRERRRMLFELLKRDMATHSIVYVGYSHRDPNWKMVLAELRSEFAPSQIPPSFRICPDTDPLDMEILQAAQLTTIDMGLTDFVREATGMLSSAAIEPRNLLRMRQGVPPDLVTAFETTPAATMRLLRSWVYVNQAPFSEPANVHAFLRGERPNWGLIGQSLQFERDVEEMLMEPLLDYATARSDGQPVSLLLAPAGYGVTTILMSVASRLARENAGPVFFHRDGAPVSEGDIEFACTLFKVRPYFFIDNAADNASAIQAAQLHVRQLRKSAFFLLGERRNEWRQLIRTPRAREIPVDPLSEGEIQRLIECLERHRALGQLTNLGPELRAAAIREKHDRQLLVAMREATEGKAFDAIIEGEFRGIADDLSRRLYSVVSCAYKLRQHIRDGVLSSVLGVNIAEMYTQTKKATDGVVDYECIDEAQGVYAARCRHHAIAEIIWERCVPNAEREDILLRLVGTLNLNYRTDVMLFDILVQSDRQIDSLRALEPKMEFFELACRKDPRSPFVRQHFARMLLREGKLDSALAHIDTAIAMSPRVRVLYHTRGVILRQMALSIESVDIARRRLVQSEEAFRKALHETKLDAYAYQSLAELYLGWAKRAATADEQAAYIAKCEMTISEGLREARQRSGLWIVSAQVQRWLGDRPQAIEMLKNASENAVAQYLLADAYRRDHDPVKAIEVLKPIIQADPTDPRICMCYAHSLLEQGETYAEAIAVLRLANLYGMRDPRYIATLGGMLFMNGQFTDADTVFGAATAQNFPSEEEQRIHYRPHMPLSPETPVEFDGEVASVRGGYVWIAVHGYPNIFCHASKVRGFIMRKGSKLRFKIGFNARGATALSPRPVQV